MRQPSGTVTLVFTDIEGSTRLLGELGEVRYREALLPEPVAQIAPKVEALALVDPGSTEPAQSEVQAETSVTSVSTSTPSVEAPIVQAERSIDSRPDEASTCIGRESIDHMSTRRPSART